MAPTSRHGLLANPKTKHIFPTMHSNLFDQIEEKCTYFSFLSNSLSSCRLRELPPVIDPSSGTTPDRGLDGLLNGVEVKQVFGLERGRSALTGVGFILLVGLDALRNNRSGQIVWKLHVQIYIYDSTYVRLVQTHAGEMGEEPTGGNSSKLLKLSWPTDGGETCSIILPYPSPPLTDLLPPVSSI